MKELFRSFYSCLAEESHHLGSLEDIQTRQQRNLLRIGLLSALLLNVFLIPDYFLLPDIFYMWLVPIAVVATPLALWGLHLSQRRRPAAGVRILFLAFSGTAVAEFAALHASTAPPDMRAMFSSGVCCIMLMLSSWLWGNHLAKAIACCAAIVCAEFYQIATVPALSWRARLTLAGVNVTYLLLAVLASQSMKANQRQFVDESQRLILALGSGRHSLWAIHLHSGLVETIRPGTSGSARELSLSLDRHLDHIHPEDRDHVRDHLAACQSQEKIEPCQFRARMSGDGEYQWLEATCRVVEFDGQGKPATLLAVTNNITDRTRLTRKLQQQSEELLRATESRAEFLATMSHEIRTPLVGILGTASLIGSAELNAYQRDLLRTVETSGAALLNTLNDVLDFCKLDAGKLTLSKAPFEVRQMAEHCMARIAEAAAAKGLQTALTVDPAVPARVEADSFYLGKVLNHLLANAVRFSAEGKIDLEVSRPSHGWLRFVVRDHGIGISPEAQKRLFSPFTHLHEGGLTGEGGSGLGLAVSKRLVDAMSGSLACTSAPGAGTSFTIDIPARAAGDAPAPGQRRAHAIRDVLVAEDSALNQHLIQRLLEKIGYAARVVSDGAQAVQAVHEGFSGIILMDCEMPVMDGLEATRTIRALPQGRDLPIIALSAHSAGEQAAACAAAGMTGFLSKPVDPDMLREQLESV